MKNGFIKLHRSFKDWYGSSDPYRLSLWIHILLLANHAPKKWLFKGNPYDVKRGQCITSRKTLSEVSGVSQSKIQRLLVEFEKEGQIEQQTSNISRLITITNYNKYQDNEQQMNNKRTTDEQQMNTNKKNKNIKNEKKQKEGWFLEFWKQYPISQRQGKEVALKRFLSTVEDETKLACFKKAFIKYINSEKVKKGFILRGSRWFGEWEDWADYIPEATELSGFEQFKLEKELEDANNK